MKNDSIQFAREPDAAAAVPEPVWEARLKLGFRHDSADTGITRLVERQHSGPLRVQKALYPEGDNVCHAVVIHPPGGVVGGDTLALNICLEPRAQALLTTPGAAKWYKANGKISRQTVQMAVAEAACLEYLPQESIFFNDAHVELTQNIVLADHASYLGCDILCFGRTAAGENFNHGTIRQHLTLRKNGKLLWYEQGQLTGANNARPLALAGNTVLATFIAVGNTVPVAVMQTLRDAAAQRMRAPESFGISQLKGLVVVRYLGHSSEDAKHLMLLAWQHLRPVIAGRDAIDLRMWNT